MKKPTIATICMMFAVLITTLAFAAPGKGFAQDHRGGWPGHNLRLEKMALMLDLSEDQKCRAQAILEDSSKTMELAHEQSQNNRKALRTMQQADTFDKNLAQKLARALADSHVEVMAARHVFRQQLDALLTPKQLEKKNQLRSIREQRHAEQLHRHGENRRPDFW